MNNYTACHYDIDHPPATYKFPITDIPDFDRDAKHTTWFFRSCYEHKLDKFWVIGIPAAHAAFCVQDIARMTHRMKTTMDFPLSFTWS